MFRIPWFKVDDTLAFHQKAVQAGNAMALWVRAGSWCCQQLTDGFVPDHMVSMLGRADHAKSLTNVGLWERDQNRGGYVFHDWDHYQPTKAEVEADRARERDKKRAQRARGSQNVDRDPTNGQFVSPGDTPRDSLWDATGIPGWTPQGSPGVRPPLPDPSRPITTVDETFHHVVQVGNAREQETR